MNRTEFAVFRDGHYATIAEINDAKGQDYAGYDDALKNFKDAAAEMGVSPYTIWFVYFHKHLSAIRTFLREGEVASEPIEGRIHDAILYLFLLLGLIHDMRELELAESRRRELAERGQALAEEHLEESQVEPSA